MTLEHLHTDVAVIGAGMAGLAAAFAARDAGLDVLVLSAAAPGAGSATTITRMAGAFVSAALGPDDTPARHAADTRASGRGLAGGEHVAVFADGVAAEVQRLERLGVHFRRTADGAYYLFRSPGHSRDRTIAHGPGAADSVAGILAAAARDRGVRFLGDTLVTGLHGTPEGTGAVSGWRGRQREAVVVSCGSVVLASGGSGLTYLRSGIPSGVPGNGYALALEAGCPLVDMEFLQMYPTALAEEGQHHHLLQYEYLLQLGAVLRNATGDDVLADAADEPEAITRDELCQRIGEQILQGGVDKEGRLHFDVSSCRPADEHPILRDSPYVSIIGPRFGRPGERVHIAPTAHTFLGGVSGDTAGATVAPGLYACGEAMGGVHGANRLQGNALAECAVIGRRAGAAAATRARDGARGLGLDDARAAAGELQARLGRRDGPPAGGVLGELQSVMSTNVGLVRSARSLERAQAQLADLREQAGRANATSAREERVLAVLPQLVVTAEAVARAASARKESRGAHFRSDAPVESADGSTFRTVVEGRAAERVTTAPVVGAGVSRAGP